jgi:F-type H+-transporting ATPase subunit delta
LAEGLQAKRFAQAVFEIARERNEMDQWSRDLTKIAALTSHDELVSVLANPRFSIENKRQLLDFYLKGTNPLAVNLTYLLTGRGCFHLITQISELYQQLLDDFRGIDRAEITTAVSLDKDARQRLIDRLSTITGKKIVFIEKIDPGIIGGMIARVGGQIIDGSTQTRLNALKKDLAGTS